MPYLRGDIIEVNLSMPPNGKVMNHPAIIISNNEVYLDDECYIVVMITSSLQNDKYSFVIEDYMLTQPNNKPHSEARCHLITYILQSHIVSGRSKNKLRKQYVDDLVNHINNCALF